MRSAVEREFVWSHEKGAYVVTETWTENGKRFGRWMYSATWRARDFPPLPAPPTPAPEAGGAAAAAE